jgi:hypothetical protein
MATAWTFVHSVRLKLVFMAAGRSEWRKILGRFRENHSDAKLWLSPIYWSWSLERKIICWFRKAEWGIARSWKSQAYLANQCNLDILRLSERRVLWEMWLFSSTAGRMSDTAAASMSSRIVGVPAIQWACIGIMMGFHWQLSNDVTHGGNTPIHSLLDILHHYRVRTNAWGIGEVFESRTDTANELWLVLGMPTIKPVGMKIRFIIWCQDGVIARYDLIITIILLPHVNDSTNSAGVLRVIPIWSLEYKLRPIRKSAARSGIWRDCLSRWSTIIPMKPLKTSSLLSEEFRELILCHLTEETLGTVLHTITGSNAFTNDISCIKTQWSVGEKVRISSRDRWRLIVPEWSTIHN